MSGFTQHVQYVRLSGDYPALTEEAMRWYNTTPIIKNVLPWYVICARAQFLGHPLTLAELQQLCDYDELPEGINADRPCQWTVTGNDNKAWPCDYRFRPLKTTIVQADGSLLEHDGEPIVRGAYIVIRCEDGSFALTGPFCPEHLKLARDMVPEKHLPVQCLTAAQARADELNQRHQQWLEECVRREADVAANRIKFQRRHGPADRRYRRNIMNRVA